MLKSGFSSQSGGRLLGRLEDCGAGLGDRPGADGENPSPGIDFSIDFAASPGKSLRPEELSEDVDAHFGLNMGVGRRALDCP